MPNTNTKDLSLSIIQLFIEFAKIFFSCFLTIFVNQLCYGADPKLIAILDTINNTASRLLQETNELRLECTVSQNLALEYYTGFDITVLAFNVITFICFLLNFIFEIYRERFIITNFDYDENKNRGVILTMFYEHPSLCSKYLDYTYRLLYTNSVCIIMMLLNILFSGISIFLFYYNGVKSATSFVTSILLIVQKVYKNHEILQESAKLKIVQSTVFFTPYYYNILDITNNSNTATIAESDV